ncbi:hypothetical protein MMPV_003500 [Pyropia vietnamensis]
MGVGRRLAALWWLTWDLFTQRLRHHPILGAAGRAAAAHPLLASPHPHPGAATTGSSAGMTVVVTGGNAGVGAATAKRLAAAGAVVVLACRSLERAEAAAERINAGLGVATGGGGNSSRGGDGSTSGGRVTVGPPLDVGDLSSVRRFVSTWRAEGRGPIGALICNAGVMAAGRAVPEAHWLVNHLGHFLLTLLLLPELGADAGGGAVVVLSSLTALAGVVSPSMATPAVPYNPMAAYAASKLANVLFVRALTARLAAGLATGGGRRATACAPLVVAVHPGDVATSVTRHLPRALQVAKDWLVTPIFLLDPDAGCRTVVYAAAAAEAVASSAGGAVWGGGGSGGGLGGQLLYDVNRVWPLAVDDAEVASVWAQSVADVRLSREEATSIERYLQL